MLAKAMNKLHHIERLHQLFTTRRRRLSLADLSNDLKLEPSQTEELLQLMQQQLDSPIHFCENSQTYAYPDDACGRYKLPQCWLKPEEFIQLVSLDHQLNKALPGLLHEDLAGLAEQLQQALQKRKLSLHQFQRRIKYHSDTLHYQYPPLFSQLCAGLLERRQLAITYLDDQHQRQGINVCPQLLLHHNRSWQLTYWCHLNRQLRCLDIARIQSITELGGRAREIAPKNVEIFWGNQFGHNQKQPLTLQLCFTGDSAHQVAFQCWHPEQQGHWHGSEYHLSLPLLDQDRLMSQILSHLPNVRVLQPSQFAQRLTAVLQQAMQQQALPAASIPACPSVQTTEHPAAVQTSEALIDAPLSLQKAQA